MWQPVYLSPKLLVRLIYGLRTLLCSAFIGLIERNLLKIFDILLVGQQLGKIEPHSKLVGVRSGNLSILLSRMIGQNELFCLIRLLKPMEVR